MDYLQNHCWCSDSNWGGHYDCRHIVGISSYKEDKEDWQSLIDKDADTFVEERRMRITNKIRKENGKEEITDRSYFEQRAPNLKPHVLQWLEDNVKDRPDPECEKGWCIGSAEYRGTNPVEFSVFFHRKNDAMKFIKTFSKYKKPVNYCQYFTDVRKTLNLETLKYEERQ